MKKLYFILFGTVITLALFVIPNPLVADDLMIGAVIHRFTGAPECIVGSPPLEDPPLEFLVIETEGVRPNDVYELTQFSHNRCENDITAGLILDVPVEFHWIHVEKEDSELVYSFGDDPVRHEATVTFGNDTPADFSAKDVRWKVIRPE